MVQGVSYVLHTPRWGLLYLIGEGEEKGRVSSEGEDTSFEMAIKLLP